MPRVMMGLGGVLLLGSGPCEEWCVVSVERCAARSPVHPPPPPYLPPYTPPPPSHAGLGVPPQCSLMARCVSGKPCIACPT
jgi:hypothetical protein